LPLIYPAGLTRELQLMLGLGVLAINAILYAWIWRRRAYRTA
jgi:type II secretory pathway component PulM